MTRGTYAHDAYLLMATGSDTGVPGAAITAALCGHGEHDPPCPLAPHHCGVSTSGGEVHLRILFASTADDANVGHPHRSATG